MKRARIALFVIASAVCGGAVGAPTTYALDPNHTYPSFEADHMGISNWRGKFNRTTGHVTLDRGAETGTVEVTVDLGSVDFGHEEMNEHAVSAEFFDVARYPEATYRGRLEGFVDGAPTRVVGELDLHGVTQPVTLEIESFKCIEHPMLKREVCGADLYGTFDREPFDLTAGKAFGFSMEVTLRIQAEAVQTQ